MLSRPTSVAILVLGLGAVGACGGPVGGAASARPAPNQLVLAAPAVSGEDAMLRVADALRGTTAQRDARDRVEHVRFQNGIEQCMSRSGFEYNPPALTPSGRAASGRHLPALSDAVIEISDGVDWPHHFGIGTTAKLALQELALLGLAPGELAPNPGYDAVPDKAGYDQLLDECAQNVPEPLGGGSEALWLDLMEVAQAALGTDGELQAAAESYAGCMAGAGIEGVQSRMELGQVLAQEYSSVALAHGVDSDQWRSVEDRERAAAEADAVCRSDAHARAMEIATPIVLQWEREHLAELDAQRRAWQALEVEATTIWPEFSAAHPLSG